MEHQAIELDSHMDLLQIPQSDDSSAQVARKLTALVQAVRCGQSIAAVTKPFGMVYEETVYLWLVKAMARIIGAERHLVGGQYALNATQLADLQTINRILSISTEILKKSRKDPLSAIISSAQRVLGSQREMLRQMLANNGRKRKEAP
ncbi:hypothetical protein PRK78_002060 [Emydomyces testavorans]|uniref:Uncharacterized protein n=1 Tax=Emydomyces testavorans TaxID=2070801 RepID=A0AAF0DDQ4_9EURO|nr:hypothetical protein PRK78_002060 [Emydomyces testavorans]